MQQGLLLQEQRSVSSCNDRGGNNLVTELDETRFAGDCRPSRTGATQRQGGGWMRRIARALASITNAKARPCPTADHGIHQLLKGRTKRVHLTNGGRLSCRTGRVWITLDEGGEDIVLTARESKSFDPGAYLLVEALAASSVSLQRL